MPRITVMIPVYNGERYIAEALDSVLSQPFSDLEILVLDDGSNDSTPRICQRYAEKDERVVLFRHENVGLGRNRNLGYSRVTGKWLVFLDHDDVLSPGVLSNKLARALDACEQLGVGMVVTSRVRSDSRLQNMKFDPIPLDGIHPSQDGCSWQIAYELATNIYRSDVILDNRIFFAETRPEMESIFRHQAAFLAGKVLFCRDSALEVRRGCETQVTKNWNQLHMRAVRVAGYSTLPDWHRQHGSDPHDLRSAYKLYCETIVDYFRYSLRKGITLHALVEELQEAGVPDSALSPSENYTISANLLLDLFQRRWVTPLRIIVFLQTVVHVFRKVSRKLVFLARSRAISAVELKSMAKELPDNIISLLRST